MLWITRDRPKIDRIACPWLIARFIDTAPEFLDVVGVPKCSTRRRRLAPHLTTSRASKTTHVGDLCSFDAFLSKYQLADPALLQLAEIVRGADTSRLDLTPQSAGLYALSRACRTISATTTKC